MEPLSQPPKPTPSRPARLESIDWLRGFVMVVMALDHVRDFFSNAMVDPTDLDRAPASLFLTRWITHYCAPVFLCVAGMAAFLYGNKGRTRAELARFLVTRGLWLILLELTIVRFGWRWELRILEVNHLATIWAIGCSMLILAVLVWFPIRMIASFSVGVILLHNALDYVTPEFFGPLGGLWKVLHAGGEIVLPGGTQVIAVYPVLPWAGVMAGGYVLGTLYVGDATRRQWWLTRLGVGMILGFFALRWTNAYGDPAIWWTHKNGLFTFFSWLNCTKYPPSLLYLAMTLGPAFLLLAWLERGTPRWGRWIIVFGRVPMFYYLLHLLLIHAVSIGAHRLAGKTQAAQLLQGGFLFGDKPADYGFPLVVVYLVWVAVVVGLYPLCAAFSRYKSRNRAEWLSYL